MQAAPPDVLIKMLRRHFQKAAVCIVPCSAATGTYDVTLLAAGKVTETEMKPTDRQLRILMEIVKEYIATGSPVGSKLLSGSLPFNVSSATIRNEMSELIGMGYLVQPHTSAGRVPSVKGFRLYVDSLAGGDIDSGEKSHIDGMLGSTDDPDRLMENAGHTLAEITNCAALLTTPADGGVTVHRIDAVPLGSRTGLIILVTSSGTVQSRVYRLDCDATPELLCAFADIADKHFVGHELSELSRSYMQTVAASLPFEHMLVSPMLISLAQAAESAGRSHVKMDGGDNLLCGFDGEQARSLFGFLSREQDMLALLNAAGDGINVIFGDETGLSALKTSSVVVRSYSIDGGRGQVGIIGPLRMDYAGVIPKIEYFARSFEKRMREVLGR